MAKHTTRKNENKAETLARRVQRAAKYANAATFTRSGRTQSTAKGAI